MLSWVSSGAFGIEAGPWCQSEYDFQASCLQEEGARIACVPKAFFGKKVVADLVLHC